jgi:hypothetical protein
VWFLGQTALLHPSVNVSSLQTKTQINLPDCLFGPYSLMLIFKTGTDIAKMLKNTLDGFSFEK